MSIRLLRNALNSIVPTWLSNRAGLNSGFKVLYTIALIGDCYLEGVWEGFQAALGIGTPTAFPYLGQARGLLQGPTESDDSFTNRLKNWLATWEEAGSAEILAQQIQVYLVGQGTLGAGILPIVRVINRSGTWVTANSDGTTTKVTGAPFNWDETLGWDDGTLHQLGEVVSGYWSDSWIVIAPNNSTPIFAPYTGTDDPAWLANFGPAATFGAGCQIPLAVANGILQLIHTWSGAHMWVRAVILAADNTSYSPGTPTADGTFGDWSKLVGGVQVPAREPTARFIIPPFGGN